MRKGLWLGGALLLAASCGATPIQSWGPPTEPAAPKAKRRCANAEAIALWRGDSRTASPESIAVFGDFVYWTDLAIAGFASDWHRGRILRAPACGGAAVELSTGRYQPTALRVDESGVYWIDGLTDRYALMALPAGASAPITLFSDPRRTSQGYVLDGSSVYWTDTDLASFDGQHPYGRGRLMRVSKGGGDVVEVASFDKLVTLIGGDATRLWGITNEETRAIVAYSKADGGMRRIAPAIGAYGPVAGGPTSFYLGTERGLAVLSGEDGAQRVLAPDMRPERIAADLGGVYWLDVGTPGLARVMSLSASGGGPREVARDTRRAMNDVAVADGQLYWTLGGGDQAALMMAPTSP